MSPTRTGCGLVVIALVAALAGPAGAQNLNQGKSASKLYAETCAACHRSARGLAKGRFSLTLYLFLQKHYTSDSSSAWALASYLNSVDAGKRGTRSATGPTSPASGAARSALRPPAAVPTR
jgi:mono/diheme cytochrome c family protein